MAKPPAKKSTKKPAKRYFGGGPVGINIPRMGGPIGGQRLAQGTPMANPSQSAMQQMAANPLQSQAQMTTAKLRGMKKGGKVKMAAGGLFTPKRLRGRDGPSDTLAYTSKPDTEGLRGMPSVDASKMDTTPKTPTKSVSFSEAFRAARKDGRSDFSWNGKKYTTEVRGETKGQAKPASASPSKPAATSAKPAAPKTLADMAKTGPAIAARPAAPDANLPKTPPVPKTAPTANFPQPSKWEANTIANRARIRNNQVSANRAEMRKDAAAKRRREDALANVNRIASEARTKNEANAATEKQKAAQRAEEARKRASAARAAASKRSGPSTTMGRNPPFTGKGGSTGGGGATGSEYKRGGKAKAKKRYV